MPSKYNAVRTEVDGIIFASKREAVRYSELILLLNLGLISEFQLQVKYSLDVNGVHICNYIADFVYFDWREEKRIIEDVKGMKTQVYTLKKKLMKACYGIDILET